MTNGSDSGGSSYNEEFGQFGQFFQIAAVGEVPENYDTGANQRLMLHVPTHNTRLNMGDVDGRHAHYNGFGAYTDAHTMVSSMNGGAANCSMTLEAMGHVVVQSLGGETSVYATAKGSSLISAQGALMVSGAGGAVLHGGATMGIGDAVADDRSGDAPSLADVGQETANTMSWGGRLWAAADGAVAAYCVASGARGSYKSSETKGFKSAGMAAVAQGLGGISGALCASVGVAGVAGVDPVGGAVVHGDAAVVVGSPLFVSIYGGIGLTMASLNAAFLGAVDVGAFGYSEIKIDSAKKASIGSGDECQVVSKGTTIAGCKKGPAYLEGDTVVIGKGGDSESVAVFGSDCVGLDSKDGADVVATNGANLLSKKEMIVGAADNLGISAGKYVALGAKDAHIVSTKRALVVGVGDALPQPPDRPAEPTKPIGPTQTAAYNAEVKANAEAFAKKCADYSKKLNKAKASWTQIKLTKSTIEVKVEGKTLTGTKKAWKFNKKNLVIKA